jgi:hypothetical protein
MSKPDWSKAGKRLRHSPRQHGRNADWNDAAQRWKTAEEYAGETLSVSEVQATPCPREGCFGMYGHACTDARKNDMDGPHAERRVAAGAALIAKGWKLEQA